MLLNISSKPNNNGRHTRKNMNSQTEQNSRKNSWTQTTRHARHYGNLKGSNGNIKVLNKLI